MSGTAVHQITTAGPRPATPTSVLGRRATAGLIGLLLLLAGISWAGVVGGAGAMAGMVDGLARIGAGMSEAAMGAGGMTQTGLAWADAGVFLAMWVVMMAAMMLPTTLPMVLAHRMVTAQRGEGPATTGLFVAGYLLVWSVIGLLPAAAFLGFQRVSVGSGTSRWLSLLAGGVLVVAGLYQFTAWKAACLRACRSPMHFLLTHDFRTGGRGALRAGVVHGAFCLGCCWALMSVLVVVGFMNLVWMAGLSVILLAEKSWRHGVVLTPVAGTAVAGLGLAVAAWPGLLHTVS